MKKSKYQQCFHCLHTRSTCILVQLLIMVTVLISAAFRGVALIRGEAHIREKSLFQCEHPRVRRLLEGGAYLRLGTYSQVFNRRDSSPINYSAFCHPSQPSCNPRLLILENFASLPFSSRLPIY